MRLILATMRYETNIFSPLLTPLRAFGPKSGEKAVEIYHGTKNPTAAYIDLAEAAGAELVMAVSGSAHPSGCAEDAVIDYFADAVIDTLQPGCDALFLDLHGGMATVGASAREAGLGAAAQVQAFRNALGEGVVVAVGGQG